VASRLTGLKSRLEGETMQAEAGGIDGRTGQLEIGIEATPERV